MQVNGLMKLYDSVINQTIGFENIELILVDDGVLIVVKRFVNNIKNEYPDNINYYKKMGSSLSKKFRIKLLMENMWIFRLWW